MLQGRLATTQQQQQPSKALQRPVPWPTIPPADLRLLEDIKALARTATPTGDLVFANGSEALRQYLIGLHLHAPALIQAAKEFPILLAKFRNTAHKSTRRSKQLRQNNKTIELLNARNQTLNRGCIELETENRDLNIRLAARDAKIEELEREQEELKRELERQRTATSHWQQRVHALQMQQGRTTPLRF